MHFFQEAILSFMTGLKLLPTFLHEMPSFLGFRSTIQAR